MTLDEAIRAEIDAGLVDPHAIAAKIMGRDRRWLTKELLAIGLEVIADRARHEIRMARHASEPRPLAVNPVVAKWPSLIGQSVNVPDLGWKPIADLTADDCRAVAAHYRKLEGSARVRAEFYESAADRIEIEGVATLGQVSGGDLLAEAA